MMDIDQPNPLEVATSRAVSSMTISKDGHITSISPRFLLEYMGQQVPSNTFAIEEFVGRKADEVLANKLLQKKDLSSTRFKLLRSIVESSRTNLLKIKSPPIIQVETPRGIRHIQIRGEFKRNSENEIEQTILFFEDRTEEIKEKEFNEWILKTTQEISADGYHGNVETCLSALSKLLNADQAVFISHEKKEGVHTRYSQKIEALYGFGVHSEVDSDFFLDEKKIGYKILNERKAIIENESDQDDFLHAENRTQSSMGIPVLEKGELVGEMLFFSDNGIFTTGDSKRLEKASQTFSSVLQLSRRGSFDTLTGIPNRAEFIENFINILNDAWLLRLYQAGLISEDKLRPGHKPQDLAISIKVGLALGDIDNLKYWNSRYGENTGDAVIKVLGRLWNLHHRADDRAGRYNADAFTMAAGFCTLDSLIAYADHSKSHIKKNAKVELVRELNTDSQDIKDAQERYPITPSVSIGLAIEDLSSLPPNTDWETERGRIMDRMIAHASLASHQVKLQGNNVSGRDRILLYNDRSPDQIKDFHRIDEVEAEWMNGNPTKQDHTVRRIFFIRSDDPPVELEKYQGGNVDTILMYEPIDGEFELKRGIRRWFRVDPLRGTVEEKNLHEDQKRVDLEGFKKRIHG